MRTMGLDVGEKTIGVAVSDPLGLTAQGVDVIRRVNFERDLSRLQELISEYNVNEIVIGFPKNMNGTVGPRAKQCRAFAGSIHEHLRMPVILWDERLTTAAAEKTLISADVNRKKRKEVVDKLAASLILQSYLDGRRRNTHA